MENVCVCPVRVSAPGVLPPPCSALPVASHTAGDFVLFSGSCSRRGRLLLKQHRAKEK